MIWTDSFAGIGEHDPENGKNSLPGVGGHDLDSGIKNTWN
jgi:hypothetical protein